MKRLLERLREWWRGLKRRYDAQLDKEVEYAFGDLIRAAELGDKYERLQRFYPNILARLEASAERRERNLKYGC